MKKHTLLQRLLPLAMLAAMLLPAVHAAAAFRDTAGHWAEKTLDEWQDEGLIDGYGDGSFRPGTTVTREQMAAFLFRFAKAQGLDTTQGGMAVREFADYDSISGWAGQSMTWAVNAGILSGRGNNTLAPTAGATRAEMAVMLQQFVGLMEK